MQAGYVHPENQGGFQSGAPRSIDISTLDRTPRVIEPRTREIYRGLFAGTLLAVFAILVLSPLYAALFYPDRLDNVLKVSTGRLLQPCPCLAPSSASTSVQHEIA